MMRLDAMPGCLRRLARLGFVGVCLGVPIGFGFVAAPPQQQGAEVGIQRTYVNTPYVKLPIEIEPGQRNQLKGLLLFMKDGPQSGWTKADQGPPQQTEFVFRAQHEGEYWFRIVAIDTQGRSMPSDLNRDIQDAVVVVVDAKAPEIELRYLGSPPDGITVQCDVRDANLDPLQTRFFYQTQDQVWRPLDPTPGRPGQYCIPRQAVLTNMVKVMAADLARNPATRVYNLGELAASPGTAAAGQVLAALPPNQVAPPPIPPVMGTIPPPAPPRNGGVLPQSIPSPIAGAMPPPIPGPPPGPMITTPDTPKSSGTTIAVSQGDDLRTPPHDFNAARPPVTSPVTSSPPPPIQRNDSGMIRPVHAADAAAANGSTGSMGSTPSTTAGNLASRQAKSPTQVVGNPTVYLNYDFENLGASGVGRIEVWATSDNSQTWSKMVDDPNCKKPAEVRFPGEGLYGVKIVAANGRGYGADAPQSGDPADWWIEVDMTKPAASIMAIKSGTGAESGTLTVFWKAEDKNLADDGIDLYWSATDGPWQPVAKNLRNDKAYEGQYRWTPPTQAGAQSYLRLVVRDRAGNTAISQTVQPIPLDDMSRPRVRVLNVTTAPQPTPVTAPAVLNPPPSPRSGLVPVQATTPPDGPMLSGPGPKLGVDTR